MTPSSIGHDQELLADEYLVMLRDLASEVEAAMAALCGNELPKFRQHVARQEDLCARLQEVVITLSAARSMGPSKLSVSGDSKIERQLHAAHVKLSEVNHQYALLMQRSNRSLSLLTALCRTYSDRFDQRSPRQPQYATWSCEI